MLHNIKKIRRVDPLAVNDFESTLNILKIERGDPFVTLERYIRYTLYPEFLKSCRKAMTIVALFYRKEPTKK